MDDFSAKPGVPNVYGLVGGDANAVGPNKRPLSSMSPTIVVKDGKTWLVTGSPGGSRIITTVLQMVVNSIDYGMNVAELRMRRVSTISGCRTSCVSKEGLAWIRSSCWKQKVRKWR